MSIEKLLTSSSVFRRVYYITKKKLNKINAFRFHGKIIDRSKGNEKLCVILAGYKEFLYESVFGRIIEYIPKDVDVCVCSSGLYSKTLNSICADNQWSYVYMKKNQVALIQNIAIKMHPNAKFIFKLDEDVFITENYFDNMIKAYEHACSGNFIPGIIAPLLLINGYSSPRIIDKLGLRDQYEKLFGKLFYATGRDQLIETSPSFAKFMWGENSIMPTIDEMNSRFAIEVLSEKPCPYRFSIGAILFTRELWEKMGYFHVNRILSGMGADEEQICSYCFLNSRPIMVSENIVVGHLSFGLQNEEMKKYYSEHKPLFNTKSYC